MASSKNNKHDSFQFWTWVELWGSWLTTRGRVKGITPVHAQMKELVSLVFKSNFCLELFNCRDPVSTCARQDYWNDNVPAPFGRAWTFLSRPFLEVFFPAQLFTSRGKTSAPLGLCHNVLLGALGWLEHGSTGEIWAALEFRTSCIRGGSRWKTLTGVSTPFLKVLCWETCLRTVTRMSQRCMKDGEVLQVPLLPEKLLSDSLWCILAEMVSFWLLKL